MARRNCTFKQRDVTAAAKALRAAGYEIGGVEVREQGFRIFVATSSPTLDDDLDRELAQFVRTHDG
jgi:hypothetical protein